MARRKAQQAEPPQAAPAKVATTQIQIRDDVVLGYRLKILLYDLQNLNQNPQSARRLNATTDVHYLSEPYFTPEQADAVKQAAVCEISQEETTGYILSKPMIGRTVQEAIQLHLGGFLAKRHGSNDKRPCGTHDILPLYMALFGLDKACLEDERFLGRLKKDRLK